ncbi:MAG: multiubiquitin domain-containing protein [Gammaproteobacteria bacterium]|nr:multiubiquitin domain-containing protein [Gammaproteobacteria bacterium]
MSHHDENKGNIRVHIDQKLYHSPNPTTGEALYALAGVRDGFDLFREVDGNREDTPVPDDDTPVHLRLDDHFHSAEAREKTFWVVVNGERKEVTKKILTFNEVVALAFSNPPSGPDVRFTITFKKAAGPKREGSMLPGDTVKIKNGTIFSVTVTDKS